MEYLQYSKEEKILSNSSFAVLNLIINGIPSIPFINFKWEFF